MTIYILFFTSLVLFLNNETLSKEHGIYTSTMKSIGRIVGGYNTPIEEVPYQAYLLIYQKGAMGSCGGSIISSRYILTAAHCLTGARAIFVRVGSINSSRGGSLYITSSYKIHPNYDENLVDYDIAYVDLEKNIDLDGTKTKAVQLADANKAIEPETEVVISGWGLTSESGEESENLKAVKVLTVSREKCRRSYSKITDRMFCAGIPIGGKDACTGDSGGPAVSTGDGTQVGVVSFGHGCARPDTPGVYTKISSVREWIRTNTGV